MISKGGNIAAPAQEAAAMAAAAAATLFPGCHGHHCCHRRGLRPWTIHRLDRRVWACSARQSTSWLSAAVSLPRLDWTAGTTFSSR